MNRYAEHDRIGVYRVLRNSGFTIKKYTGSYPYLKNGIMVESSEAEPVYSYGKNYKNDVGEFSLFVWTTNKNKKEVEDRLDQASNRVTVDKINGTSTIGSFVYLD